MNMMRTWMRLSVCSIAQLCLACGSGVGETGGFGSGTSETAGTSSSGGGVAETGESSGSESAAGDGDGSPGDGDGDGDGDGSPGDGDGDGAPNVVPCDIPEIAIATMTPHVILVLDKSGSMIQHTWDHDDDPSTAEVTRWHSLHRVVDTIVNSFDGKFEFGAQLFPSTSATNDYDEDACLVDTPPDVAIGPNNAVNVLLGIPVANSGNIRGGTPAAAGMHSAIDHLVGQDDGSPAAVVLLTDGAANCRSDASSEFERFETYDPELPAVVADAFSGLNIPTYVVGIDISDALTGTTGIDDFPPDGEPDAISPFAKLNELAVLGGKPLGGLTDFYQTQNELELQAALQAIVDDAASCTATLDPPPPFPELVTVRIGGVEVPQVEDCASEDGWVYTDPNGPYASLVLCGAWCEQVASSPALEAEYFCEAR
jgi:hypothetical protein